MHINAAFLGARDLKSGRWSRRSRSGKKCATFPRLVKVINQALRTDVRAPHLLLRPKRREISCWGDTFEPAKCVVCGGLGGRPPRIHLVYWVRYARNLSHSNAPFVLCPAPLHYADRSQPKPRHKTNPPAQFTTNLTRPLIGQIRSNRSDNPNQSNCRQTIHGKVKQDAAKFASLQVSLRSNRAGSWRTNVESTNAIKADHWPRSNLAAFK